MSGGGAGRGPGAVRPQPIITENTVASKLRGHTCSTTPCQWPCDQGAFIKTYSMRNKQMELELEYMETNNPKMYCKKKITDKINIKYM